MLHDAVLMITKCIVSMLACVVVLGGTGPSLAGQTMTLTAPISHTCISSPFGPRVLPNLPFAGTYHYGVDLPAPAGAPVLAAAAGTVIRIQRKGPGGLEMLVQHDGFIGIYSHFGMVAPAFAEGKRSVAAGEKLGVVGRTGLSSGAHLYFEMMLDGKPIDPAPYVGVPACSAQAQHITPAKTPASGKLIAGHRYYQLLQQAQQN